MKVITIQDKANTVAKRWKTAYYSYNYSHTAKEWVKYLSNDSEATYTKLKALGATPKPEDIVAIIGNSSWTRLECDRCEQEVARVVSFKGVAYEEYGNTNLCLVCISKLYEVGKKA